MDQSKDSPQRGTCSKCHHSITKKGGSWYHSGERDVNDNIPGHFAEPMSIMDRAER